jgi:hypothetical protein
MLTEAKHEWSNSCTPCICLRDVDRNKFAFTVKHFALQRVPKMLRNPFQPPIQGKLSDLSLWLKGTEAEDNHSLPSSSERRIFSAVINSLQLNGVML